jgi:hypothetical protein
MCSDPECADRHPPIWSTVVQTPAGFMTPAYSRLQSASASPD